MCAAYYSKMATETAIPSITATPQQVQSWLRTGECVLIDVREDDEHARERIAGARLLPLSRFNAAQAVESAIGQQRIVVHCKSGTRAEDALRMTGSNTERVVLSLAGGIEGWKRANLPVVTNTAVSAFSVMRQVQLVIGLGVLGGSALAWLVHPAFVAIPAFFGAGLTFAGLSGTCGLASIIGLMPWNRTCSAKGSCCS